VIIVFFFVVLNFVAIGLVSAISGVYDQVNLPR
jgi:hypothetical protein